jgi:hypothetical protein
MRFTSRDRLTEQAADEMTGRYPDWRQRSSSSSCESAYREWARSGPRDSAIAFTAYAAALDRKERAAAHYEMALCGR